MPTNDPCQPPADTPLPAQRELAAGHGLSDDLISDDESLARDVAAEVGQASATPIEDAVNAAVDRRNLTGERRQRVHDHAVAIAFANSCRAQQDAVDAAARVLGMRMAIADLAGDDAESDRTSADVERIAGTSSLRGLQAEMRRVERRPIRKRDGFRLYLGAGRTLRPPRICPQGRTRAPRSAPSRHRGSRRVGASSRSSGGGSPGDSSDGESDPALGRALAGVTT